MEDPTKVKVRLKTGGGGPTAQRRICLLNLLRRNNISILRLIDQKDGWVIVTQSAKDVQQIASNQQIKEELSRQELEVILPNNLKCKYQLVIKKIDYTVLEYSEEQIKEEITRNEPITRNQIESIYIMHDHNIIKLKLKSLTVADKLKEN